MTTHTIDKQCNQLIQKIEQINQQLDNTDFNLDGDDEVNNIELIKQRQCYLEDLFAEAHLSWLQDNKEQLTALKNEIDRTTTKYQNWLEAIKSQLLKTKKTKKGLKVYNNIR